jgi:ATP/maltotriose-dependent transcriptional regulator MalT
LGAIERGLETAYLALKAAETQVPVYRSYVLATLAHLHLLNFDLVEAEAVINQANKDSNRNAIPLFAELIVMVEGELRLKQGHYEQALATTEPSLTTVRHFGMRRFLLSLLHLRGQAFLALGQMKQAQDCCLEARTVAEAMDARCSLWAVLFTLSQLEADSLEANQLRRQARKIVTGIVEHITTPDLQALFLDLPNVWAVLKGSQE